MSAILLRKYAVSICAGVRKFTTPIHCIAVLITSVLTQSASAAPIFFNITGHYYEFVESDATWTEARSLSNQRSFQGQVGYLATIPTVRENLFLTTSFSVDGPPRLAWIGGHEPNNDAAWRWADGPESGQRFSQSEHPVFPTFFANWGGNEPDSGAANEDFVVINLGPTFAGINSGEWSAVDANPSLSNPVRGFLVEYGGVEIVPEPSTLIWVSALVAVIGTRVLKRAYGRMNHMAKC